MNRIPPMLRDVRLWVAALIALAGILSYAVVGGALSALAAFIGSVPLLAILLCALPCLLPLAFLKRKGQNSGDLPT